MAELKSKFFVTSKEMLVSALKRVKLPRLQFSEGGVVAMYQNKLAKQKLR
jgi:hypothetical protein